MAHYRTSFVTSTPITTVFEYVGRFSTAAEWDPGVSRARDLTNEPLAVGGRFEIVSSFLGREVPLVYEVIELVAPTLVRLQAENASVRSIDTILLAQTERGTRVTYDAALTPKGLARLASPILQWWFRRVGDRAAASLRAHVDALVDSGRS
jgi:hypothetical protein